MLFEKTFIYNRYHKIYKHAAFALAHFDLPDFSEYSEDDVFNAFLHLSTDSIIYQEWLSWFHALITSLSSQRVTLQTEKFQHFIQGPAWTFLLIKDNKQKKLVIGPYSPPYTITFLKK